MKTLNRIILSFLFIASLAFAAPGDIKIDRKNSSDNAWISTIFSKQNNAILATDSSGVPTILTTLPTGVQDNITRTGTVVSGTWNGTVVTGTYGGTGVNNGSSTITLGGNLVTSGAFSTTFTVTGSTNVTLPTSGTVAALGGTNAWTGVNTFSNAQPIVITSTGAAGLQVYNTVNQTTDYERLEALWSGNVGIVRTTSAGSGTPRALRLIGTGASSAVSQITLNRVTAPFFEATITGTSLAGKNYYSITLASADTATSGTNGFLSITPTYNQASGTAANDDFSLIRTETAIGSGVQRLMNLGTTALGSQFAVSNRGMVTIAGALITAPQLLSGAGAVNVTTGSTNYTSTGVAQALTLADGVAGQRKSVIHSVDGGSGVLTPTTKIGFTTITFTNVGDAVELEYTAAGWAIVGIRGAVAA